MTTRLEVKISTKLVNSGRTAIKVSSAFKKTI